MIRRSLWIGLALPALLLVAAVEPGASGGREDDPEPGAQVLVDSLGRRLTLAGIPRRIVSLSPSSTEILFAAGAGDQVVGVTEFCNWPPQARSRAKVGGYMDQAISVEQILALQPDLVISEGGHQRRVIEALERAGVAVYVMDAQSFAEVYEALRTTGRLTGHEAEAEARVRAMRGLEQRVAAMGAEIPPERRVKVFWEVWDDPLMTVGPGVFLGEAIRLAGGINIFDNLNARYPVVSSEEVIVRDPDVILGPQDHAEALVPERLARRPGWAGVSAVRQRRIHVLDSDISSRPGARIVNALGLIARSLYPEEFRREFGDSDPMQW